MWQWSQKGQWHWQWNSCEKEGTGGRLHEPWSPHYGLRKGCNEVHGLANRAVQYHCDQCLCTDSGQAAAHYAVMLPFFILSFISCNANISLYKMKETGKLAQLTQNCLCWQQFAQSAGGHVWCRAAGKVNTEKNRYHCPLQKQVRPHCCCISPDARPTHGKVHGRRDLQVCW